MGFHSLVNTAQFSYTARDFKKNGDRYTLAPKGSRDYKEFWDEEAKRCKYGYSVGDLWIPGRYYGYLNFFPIMRVPDRLLNLAHEQIKKYGKILISEAEKEVGFAKFWECQYEWWMFKHIAWYGGTFMGVTSPGNRHLACLKTRGAGWSYQEAWDGVYNYNFIPKSKSYYFAGAEAYLTEDGIMNKVQDGLDFINKYCTPWRQNRQVNKVIPHLKASFLDERGDEQGSMSEIISQVIDNPNKTRGKRGRKATFEEAGSFKNLKKSLEIALGSLREGSLYIGQASVFGTGGEQGPGIAGLEAIFESPRTFDMLPFPNIWEDGMEGTECGYFVPCWRANSFYMDPDGNVDIQGALIADEIEREKKRLSKDPKDLDSRKAEYPRNPKEALMRLTGNGFNIAEIDNQIKRLEHGGLKALIRYGNLTGDGKGGIDFQPVPENVARPILEYPHSQVEGTDLSGAFAMIQQPYRDATGQVPVGMYRVIFDPYAKEKAEDQTSLWSFQVWKLDNPYDLSFAGVPVAWFAGRPKRYYDNHDLMFKAAQYFNADIQGEVVGGGQSVIDYARTRRLLHKLRHEPLSVSSREMESKAKDNSFLMSMPTDRKNLGLTYLEDWHVAPRGADDKGNFILNVHQIYDIAWLREMRVHDPLKGNYDRISTAIVAMYEVQENARERSTQVHEKREFFNRTLFGGAGTGDWDTGERTTFA